MQVNLQTFSAIHLANTASRSSHACNSHIGKGDGRSSDLCHLVFTSLTLGMNQTSEMAEARYEEADEVLKRMSKKMEGLSSITTHMKLAMDYGLAISEVVHTIISVGTMFIRLGFVGQPYREGWFFGCEAHARGMSSSHQ